MLVINVDEKILEARLDGYKQAADRGGEHNNFPAKYKALKDALDLVGLKVQFKNGRHVVTTH